MAWCTGRFLAPLLRKGASKSPRAPASSGSSENAALTLTASGLPGRS